MADSLADSTCAIQDRLIICLASRWGLDPTSKHHVMRILSRHNNVIWINFHASRKPRINRHDAGWILSSLKRAVRGARRINDRMIELTPLLIPGAHGRFTSAINRAVLAAQIRMVAQTLGGLKSRPVQLWSFAPDAGFLAGALGEERLVYYCVDDFAGFEGFDADRIRAAEHRLVRSADIVLASSERLFTRMQACHANAHLVRHGVDYEFFRRAVDEFWPRPEPLRSIPAPIAGFVGLVHHWFDQPLFAALARQMSDVSFVIVGECKPDVSALASLPNVHLLGRQPYEHLPAYMAHFAVGLIPFVRNEMTRSVNPIKLREYLSAGVPVVSTGLPEVEALGVQVRIANDADTFAAACREAMLTDSQADRDHRSLRMRPHSWEFVTQRIGRLVARTVQGDHQPRPILAESNLIADAAGTSINAIEH